MKLLLLLILAVPASAGQDYHTGKLVNPAKLGVELGDAGISTGNIFCGGDDCLVKDASADPSAVIAAHVYTDPKVIEDANRAAAIALVKKLRSGTITAAEQKELLGRLAFILLSR